MSRLHDAFDALIGEHPPGDPDAILAAARADASTADVGEPGPHRLLAVLGAAAAVVLVVGAIVVLTRPDDSGEVRSGRATTTPTTTTAPGATVKVFFGDATTDPCLHTKAVTRPAGEDPVRSAVTALLAGPTDEERVAGTTSPFSTETAGTLHSIALSEGMAHVDLDRAITGPIASPRASCTAGALLAQLDATLGGVLDAPEGIVYSLDGDVEAFSRWAGIPQHTQPTPVPRLVAPVTAIASEAGVAAAGNDGTGAGYSFSSAPSALAFGVPGHVVHQGRGPDGSGSERRGSGQILVWHGGQTRPLPAPVDANATVLLDTRTIDGVPTALVSDRHLGSRPDDEAWDDIVAVDLDTGARRPLARLDTSEVLTTEASLVDADLFIRIGGGGDRWSVERWTAGHDEADWSVDLEPDVVSTLALRPDAAAVISRAPDGSGRFQVQERDVETGRVLGPVTNVAPNEPLGDDTWCQDWLDEGELACSRPDDDPLSLRLDGAVRPLPHSPSARITVRS